MSKIAVLVDAGYFWVQATHVIHGTKSSRDSVTIDYAALRQEVLEQAAAQFPNAELLRVYWYDGPGPQGSKTLTHHAIDELDDFKLRLGTRNFAGDQKAVDGLIIADLIGLAQSKAISGAIVLSGDADLTPGVIAAQGLGIRVHLLSMGPANATSPFLRCEVDHKSHWADPTVEKFASAHTVARRVAVMPAKVADAPPVGGNCVEAAVPEPAPERNVLADIAAEAFTALSGDTRPIELVDGSLPSRADGKLLWLGRERLGRVLAEQEKRAIRKEFKHLVAKAAAE
jgi:hypothetical protein